jgi:hypothetical protein
MVANAKHLLLALGLILLLPGMAGAAGFGPVDDSLWGKLADPAALAARIWEGLTSIWTGGGSIDPNGGEGVNGSGSGGDGGGSIDPNG